MTKTKKLALLATFVSFIFTIVADEFNERENQAEMDRLIDERVEERVCRLWADDQVRMKALEAPGDENRS